MKNSKVEKALLLVFAIAVGLGVAVNFQKDAVASGRPLNVSVDKFSIQTVTMSSSAAQLVSAPTDFTPQDDMCLHNAGGSSTTIYISSFSTILTTDNVWPLYGGEKECHTWGYGVKFYAFQNEQQDAITLRVLRSK